MKTITLLTLGALLLGNNAFETSKVDFTEACSGEVTTKKRGQVLYCEEADRVVGAFYPKGAEFPVAYTVVKK